MGFFKTDEGVLHAGRIAGLFYLVPLLVSCGIVGQHWQMCTAQGFFTAGWWLALGGKSMPATFSVIAAQPLRMIGMILVVVGIASATYLTWVFGYHA